MSCAECKKETFMGNVRFYPTRGFICRLCDSVVNGS